MAGAQLAQSRTNFQISSGIAKPKDAVTLGVFQGLQRALEAARKRLQLGGSPVRADGDLGPKTISVLRAVAQKAAAIPGIGPRLLTLGTAKIDVVAANAAEIAQMLASVGAVGADFTPKPAARPPDATPVPGKAEPLAPPESPRAEGGIHWAWWVGGVGLLGLAGYLAWRFFGGDKTAFAGGDGYDAYDYEEAAGDFIDV